MLDCDENEALAQRRIAAMERWRHNPIAAAWIDAEAEAFARFAAEWLPKFDLVFAASNKEAKSLSAFGARAMVVPNVASAGLLRPRHRRGQFFTIVFVGALGYSPNADAVTWFVSRIWLRLERALHYRVRLIIVGSNPSTAITRLGSQRGIEVTGAVADVAPYYRDADLVIAPLRAGGGTRIKIIEAAVHGVPVVATGFGAEGTTSAWCGHVNGERRSDFSARLPVARRWFAFAAVGGAGALEGEAGLCACILAGTRGRPGRLSR